MVTAWDMFRRMDALRREFDRFYDDVDYRGPLLRFSFLPGRAARGYPLMNVGEDGDRIYVTALAPGLDPDSLNLNVMGTQLTVSGEKPALPGNIKAEAYHRNERAAGKFVRTVDLPGDVNQDKAAADYSDGILTITLPKAEQAKPKKISVKVK